MSRPRHVVLLHCPDEHAFSVLRLVLECRLRVWVVPVALSPDCVLHADHCPRAMAELIEAVRVACQRRRGPRLVRQFARHIRCMQARPPAEEKAA